MCFKNALNIPFGYSQVSFICNMIQFQEGLIGVLNSCFQPGNALAPDGEIMPEVLKFLT